MLLLIYNPLFVDSLPGSLVGAYLEQRVGKKEAMAMSTVGTAIGVLCFVFVSSQTAVMLATMCISFMGMLMPLTPCRDNVLTSPVRVQLLLCTPSSVSPLPHFRRSTPPWFKLKVALRS